MTSSKTIIKLDASALKESSCLLRTFYTIHKGYRQAINTIDVQYGLAFHAFVARMKLGNGDFSAAIREAKELFAKPSIMKTKKVYMTEQHLLKTCMDYWTQVAMVDEWKTVIHEIQILNTPENPEVIGSKLEPLVELKFALPYYQDDEVEVMLCGTIDDICRKGDNGIYAIRDYKTTSSWNIREYMEGYRLSPQLIFYVFIMQLYAKHYPDSIVAKIVGASGMQLGAMIEGIFLKGEAKSPEFVKSEIFYYKAQQMEEFKFILDCKIKEIVEMIWSLKESESMNGTYTPPRYGMLNGSCTTIYGQCKFADACSANDSRAREHVLNNNFIVKAFNPLTYNE